MPKSKSIYRIIKAALAILAAFLCAMSLSASQAGTDSGSVPVYGYKIINSYPHDTTAFTQGLVYDEGALYEGTGEYGSSTLRHVDLETGQVLKMISLEPTLFGEGIAVWKDRLIQLTWQSHTGLVYDKNNLTEIEKFTYLTEGWGTTSDGRRLIMSDGTEILHFLDPETFEEQGQIKVQEKGVAVKGLNELEYVKGDIFANVWPTGWIVIISPDTGDVKGWIDLRGILPKEDNQRVDVLNGIAYDSEGDRLFVTGKLWLRLFEIELVKKSGMSFIPERSNGRRANLRAESSPARSVTSFSVEEGVTIDGVLHFAGSSGHPTYSGKLADAEKFLNLKKNT